MTADLVLRMLFGHLIGDYLLQSSNMALRKKQSIKWAAAHCFVWTLSVCVVMMPELFRLPLWSISGMSVTSAFFLIWLSHFMLDYGWGSKFGIVDRWLHLVDSRSFDKAIQYCNDSEHTDIEKQFMIAFTAIVQTVADNALHLIFLYLILKHLVLP